MSFNKKETVKSAHMSCKRNRQEKRLPVVRKLTNASTEALDRFGWNYDSFLLNRKGRWRYTGFEEI